VSDVISLADERAKRCDLDVKERDYTKPVCRHLRVLVSEDEHLVECRDCKAKLDPHRVLLGFAKEERHFYWSTNKARRELAKLHEALEDLRRLERNAKARLRRLRKKLGEPAQQRFS
jgi:hypothetical protein